MLFSFYTIISNFNHDLLIMYKPYTYIPFTTSFYRAIFAQGLGIIFGIIRNILTTNENF